MNLSHVYWMHKKTFDVCISDEKPSEDWKRISRDRFYRIKAAQQSVQADGADWKCKKCNWFSAADLQNCVQCGSPRH